MKNILKNTRVSCTYNKEALAEEKVMIGYTVVEDEIGKIFKSERTITA